jgi:predicted DNA-binding protein with PD1-like motif
MPLALFLIASLAQLGEENVRTSLRSRRSGDIALKDGEPQVHAHVVVGRSDGTAHGGHLVEARVRPTCELILTESPIHLQKKFDPKAGIALIQI